MTQVAVFGAAGRMGATVCAAVLGAKDLELVAAIDPAAAGRPLEEVSACRGSGIEIADLAEAAETEAGAEVVVDFTVAPAALENLRWCAEHGVHAVRGTTGLDDRPIFELIRTWFSGEAMPSSPRTSRSARR